MKTAHFPISPAKEAPTKGLSKVTSEVVCNIKKCECIINIGIFFDGTDNNKDRDVVDRAHTNIARLYELYPESIQSNLRTWGWHKISRDRRIYRNGSWRWMCIRV